MAHRARPNRGARVTLVDSWLIGRTGHTAFSNAWTIVALPGDDIDGILHEIVAGNDGIADQELVRQSLMTSHDRLKDFEAMGMHFGRDEEGRWWLLEVGDGQVSGLPAAEAAAPLFAALAPLARRAGAPSPPGSPTRARPGRPAP